MIQFDVSLGWKLQTDKFIYQIGLKGGKVFHIACYPREKAANIDVKNICNRYLFMPTEAEVGINYEGMLVTHGTRNIMNSASFRAEYDSHEIIYRDSGSEELLIRQIDKQSSLAILLHYRIYADSPAIHRLVTVENGSQSDLIVHHLASFTMQGMPFHSRHDIAEELYLHTFKSSWSWEGRMKTHSMNDLGIHSTDTRFAWHIDNTSSWSCQEYSPFFIIEERSAKVFLAVQLEHSSSWRFEIGGSGLEGENWIYIQGGLGNFLHGHWSKTLKPGESFTSIPVSIAASSGTADDILNDMRKHQENVLINRNPGDLGLPIVYTEWLSTKGQVREESVRCHIKALEGTGVEVYVLDCGWYATYDPESPAGDWWVTPGDWRENEVRFPNGLKKIAEEITERGMVPGIWLEIEVLGRLADAYTELENLCMKRNGITVNDNQRRFLYFGYEEVRNRATAVFEELIEKGFRYFKIDYNVDCAPGCDNSGESLGQGMVEHIRAYYQWLEDLRSKHRDIIIENCSSGGMRLDYGMMSRADLASITDQEDYLEIGNIAFGLSHIIHPSQLGVWANAKSGYNREQFIFSLVNSMIGRPCMSSDIHNYSEEQKSLYREAIAFYKSYRDILRAPRLYYHTAQVPFSIHRGWNIAQMNSEDDTKIILFIWRYHSEDGDKNIFLKKVDPQEQYNITSFPFKGTKLLHGKELMENGFTVSLPNNESARVFKIEKA